MKKIAVALIMVLLVTPCLFADKELSIRFGFLSPSATKTSFYPGLTYGINIDDIVSMGLGVDYYYSSERETRTVSLGVTPGGTDITTMQLGSEITTHYLPLMAFVKVGVPVDLPIIPYAGVGMGWGLLWEKVFIAADDTEDPPIGKIDENNLFSGFNWALQLGSKYALSPNTGVYGEFFYNGGKMKKSIRKDAFGITWDEINMSGVGLRIGIEIRM